jgi:hypothetical protein
VPHLEPHVRQLRRLVQRQVMVAPCERQHVLLISVKGKWFQITDLI